MLALGGLRLLFVLVAVGGSFAANYPPTPRGSAADTYYGVRVPDPYRWLERTNASETKRWVREQTQLTEQAFSELPDRDRMRTLVVGLMGAKSDSLPQVGGGVSAFARSDGSGRLPYVLVVRARQQRVVIDPNRRWPDGSTSLANWRLSPNGRYVAYATKRGGLGLVRWHVMNLVTNRDLTDVVLGTPDWAPIGWAANGSGFYYGGYDGEKLASAGAPIGTGYAVRYHRLGSPQTADRLVVARPDRPTWLTYANQSADGRYEIIGAVDGSADGKYLGIRDLRAAHPVLRQIRDHRYDFVASSGSMLYFFTNVNAERGRLVAIDAKSPQKEQTIIASTADILEDVTAVGNTLIARYLRNDRSRLVAFNYTGKALVDISLPEPGSVPEVRGSQNATTAFYQFSNPTSPPITYAYSAVTRRARIIARQAAPFDTSSYTTEELFARSNDGTRIPLFVAHRRGIPMNGSVPTLLTGYGGFGDPYDPRWDPLGAAWLARGGTFVIACVRGGGEYGEAWHTAGKLGNKHHAFEDLDAVARYLVARGFASPKKLGLYGYSGGGLLIGTTEVQHPEHFGAVVEAAGPVDVLRGHTYGSEAGWAPEVGSPAISKAQFRWLYDYAPLVHIRKGVHYPPTLVRTSADDERVSPAHAFKFAATMQWAQGAGAPVLLYVARSTGHVGGGTLIDQATPLADAETFLLDELGRAG